MDDIKKLGILDKMVLSRITKADDILNLVATETGRTSELYKDGGKTAAFGRELLARAMNEDGIRKFTSADDLREEILQYFDLCRALQIPITISGISMWLSVTQQTFEKWCKRGTDPRGVVCAQAKEAVHLITENLAMEGDLNPILYMYQNKAYHNHIETSKIQLEVEGDTNRMTESEIDDVLKMHQGSDGVFRQEDLYGEG